VATVTHAGKQVKVGSVSPGTDAGPRGWSQGETQSLDKPPLGRYNDATIPSLTRG